MGKAQKAKAGHSLDECYWPDSHSAGMAAFCKWLAGFEPEVKARLKQVALSPRGAASRLSAGVPLLQWSDLSLDWPLVEECFDQVLLALAQCFPGIKTLVENASSTVEDTSDFQRVIRACYQGRSLVRLMSRGARGRDQRDVLRFAGQIALRPFLTAQQEKLASLVNNDLWRRGNCPICGGLPDFSFLEEGEGARWLVCSRCDARWLFLRLECPYCNNRNQDTLSCLLDDEGIYRVYLCDECHSYLKSVDLGKRIGELVVARQRVETVDLDRQAYLKGYRGPGTCFG